MAKSKISGQMSHCTWKYVIFKYSLILISSIIPVIKEQTLYNFNTLNHEIFAPCFMSLDMFQFLLVYKSMET